MSVAKQQSVTGPRKISSLSNWFWSSQICSQSPSARNSLHEGLGLGVEVGVGVGVMEYAYLAVRQEHITDDGENIDDDNLATRLYCIDDDDSSSTNKEHIDDHSSTRPNILTMITTTMMKFIIWVFSRNRLKLMIMMMW